MTYPLVSPCDPCLSPFSDIAGALAIGDDSFVDRCVHLHSLVDIPLLASYPYTYHHGRRKCTHSTSIRVGHPAEHSRSPEQHPPYPPRLILWSSHRRRSRFFPERSVSAQSQWRRRIDSCSVGGEESKGGDGEGQGGWTGADVSEGTGIDGWRRKLRTSDRRKR